MQNPSSSVSSGNISPTVVGPSKDTKEVYLVGWLVAVVGIIVGAFWYYSGQDEASPSKTSTELLTNAHVTNVLKAGTIQAVTPTLPKQISPVTGYKFDSIHTDLFFEVGRKGLTDEARAILATQANMVKQDPNLGILVQGHTDQQGSSDYNRKLGMKRAETVKTELMNAGVEAHQIKVVSLGKEGVLCLDNSDVCRAMNRRVHLEIRKIGKDHMVLPTVSMEPKAINPTQSADDQNSRAEASGSLVDNLLPTFADPLPTNQSPVTIDQASGS